MLDLLAQTTRQYGGRGMSNWSPTDWSVFLGALGAFLALVIKQFRTDARVSQSEDKIQTIAKATATIAEPTNPNAVLPQRQLEAVQKIGTGNDAETATEVQT
jgi:hypothetical protein